MSKQKRQKHTNEFKERRRQTDHSTGLFSGQSSTESWYKCYNL